MWRTSRGLSFHSKSLLGSKPCTRKNCFAKQRVEEDPPFLSGQQTIHIPLLIIMKLRPCVSSGNPQVGLKNMSHPVKASLVRIFVLLDLVRRLCLPVQLVSPGAAEQHSWMSDLPCHLLRNDRNHVHVLTFLRDKRRQHCFRTAWDSRQLGLANCLCFERDLQFVKYFVLFRKSPPQVVDIPRHWGGEKALGNPGQHRLYHCRDLQPARHFELCGAFNKLQTFVTLNLRIRMLSLGP